VQIRPKRIKLVKKVQDKEKLIVKNKPTTTTPPTSLDKFLKWLRNAGASAMEKKHLKHSRPKSIYWVIPKTVLRSPQCSTSLPLKRKWRPLKQSEGNT